VEITKGYWIGQTEVTQEAYQLVTRKDPSIFKGSKRPVESVSWTEAQDYCKNVGLRLPTEAEWEYAAGAASGELAAVAWYAANAAKKTHDVRGKQANGWNLYDTLGNVWEWVADWYGKDYYRKTEGKDPKGPRSGEGRVLRGWSYLENPVAVRVSDRNESPMIRNYNIGFRCAGELP
jgi:formylglycine-generating enzyme